MIQFEGTMKAVQKNQHKTTGIKEPAGFTICNIVAVCYQGGCPVSFPKQEAGSSSLNTCEERHHQWQTGCNKK